VREFGVGIIGYGFIGKVHTYAHKVLRFFYDPPPCRTKLIGVCTSNWETAIAAREHGGFDFGTTSPADLFARDDIEIVHICTPNDSHASLIEAALDAGKAVYCDKPLCVTEAEAQRIGERASTAARRHQMTFNYRFVPATMRAKRLLEEGAVGRIYQFRAAYLHSGYIDPARPLSWRLDLKRSGGGALYDLGAHAVDMMRWLVGEFDRVSAKLPILITERPVKRGATERRPVEVDDIALLTVTARSGAVGTIEATRLATGANDSLRFEIHGSDGALTFDLEAPNWLHFYDCNAADQPLGGTRGFTRIECVQRYDPPAGWPGPKFTPGWLRFHVACLQGYLSALAAGTPPQPDLMEGARTQLVLTSAQRSAAEGCEVQVARPRGDRG